MKTQDVKVEIHKVIDLLPDEVSGEVLEYLKSVLNKSADDVKTSKNLAKILQEDRNLLDRLAQ